MQLRGRCHCGNIEVEYESATPVEEMALRACGCSFCRKHGARTTSDHGGRLRIRVRDDKRLQRYRFGLRTADFLICAACGIYVATLLPDAAASWSTLNVNVLDEQARFTQPAQPVTYDNETAQQRRARRRAHWTPARLVFG